MNVPKKTIRKIIILCILLVLAAGCVLIFLTGRKSEKKAAKDTTKNSEDIHTTSGRGDSLHDEEETYPTIVVASQLASYLGEQEGWGAQLMRERFHIKLYFESFSGFTDKGAEAEEDREPDLYMLEYYDFEEGLTKGKFYDLETDHLLEKEGRPILQYFEDALNYQKAYIEHYRKKQKNVPSGIYGIGTGLEQDASDHEDFFQTWDVRYDLYQKLGKPEIADLDDFADLLILMQKEDRRLHHHKSYALAYYVAPDEGMNEMLNLYSLKNKPMDEDEVVIPYMVQTLLSAYFGYEVAGERVIDPDKNQEISMSEKKKCFQQIRHFYRKLNQAGALKVVHEYQALIDQAQKGLILSDLGLSLHSNYNNIKNLNEGRAFLPVAPEQAVSIAYSRQDVRGESVYAIAKDTKYPEECMRLLSWLYSPEGEMTLLYGPKKVCWDYDPNGSAYLTDFGKACQESSGAGASMQGGYEGGFTDGRLQFIQAGYSSLAVNPDGNGEHFDSRYWKNMKNQQGPYSPGDYEIGYADGKIFDQEYLDEIGYQTGEASVTGKLYDIEKDWCEDNQAQNIQSYFEGRKYRMAEDPDGILVQTAAERDQKWKISEKKKRKILKRHNELYKKWKEDIFGK